MREALRALVVWIAIASLAAGCGEAGPIKTGEPRPSVSALPDMGTEEPAAPTDPPAATPTPTPPDTRGPALSGVSMDPSYIYYGDQSCGPISSIISVEATDPSGVSGVTLKYVPPGMGTRTATMTRASGTTWTATVTSWVTWQRGYIDHWFEAEDGAGNASTLRPQGEQNRLFVEECNTRPSVTITQPANGSVFEFTNCSEGSLHVDVALRASASDSVPVPMSGIVWTDSIQGRLGTGAALTARLHASSCVLPGTTHVITVTVTDVGGKTDRDSISVLVRWSGPP